MIFNMEDRGQIKNLYLVKDYGAKDCLKEFITGKFNWRDELLTEQVMQN